MTLFSSFNKGKCKAKAQTMVLKKCIQKTKKLLVKTLQNIKNMLFVNYDYDGIPRTLFLNPLSCTSINYQNTHQLDIIYSQFSSTRPPPPTTTTNHGRRTVTRNSSNNCASCSGGRYGHGHGTYVLAQKMRELGMVDIGGGDVIDHALDVEEALNYYSRLSCPVYVDIVDKFLVQMYAEFDLLPQSSPISLS